MSSFNNIQKIKYTKDPADVVALNEYIMFEDTHAGEKFVVFKFSNNVNQRIFEIKFEVSQYNKDNELIEKSVVIHSDFVAEANDTFVPNAKLKVNFGCQSLEVKLLSATFDRVIWSNGEFQDNSYRFDSYAETVAKQEVQAVSKVKEEEPKEKKKSVKRNKLGYEIRNIFRANKAVFPAFFNVILSVVFIGLVVFSTFYFKNTTGAFAVGDFVVKQSSSGFVQIVHYEGTAEELEIPSTLDDKYFVTSIAGGAFKNSTVKSLIITTQKPLVIETGAFTNCKNLIAVTGFNCNQVTLLSGAFTNCTNLKSFTVATAWLNKKCFDGTNAISMLTFERVTYYRDSDARLIDIFNGLSSIQINYYMYYGTVSPIFLEGVNGN